MKRLEVENSQLKEKNKAQASELRVQSVAARGARDELTEARKEGSSSREEAAAANKEIVTLMGRIAEQDKKIADQAKEVQRSQQCLDALFSVDEADTQD